jgi:sigma-B regulation protein RsbU (phosphoserine phosphatase)
MVRPVLPATPALPAPPLKARLRHSLTGTWRGRILLGALAVWLLDALLGLVGLGAPAPLSVLAHLVLGIAALWGLWRGLRWVSARFLWRIRTKLLLSYLFVALVPVVLLSLFLSIGAVLFMGLVASHMVTEDIDREAEILRANARSALAGLPASDEAAAAVLPERLAPAGARHPEVSWTLLRKGRVVAASGDAPRALPAWWVGPGFAGLVRGAPGGETSKGDVVRGVWGREETALIVDVPADERFFAELERRTGARPFTPGTGSTTGTAGEPDTSPPESGIEIVIRDEGQTATTSMASSSGLAFVAFPARTDWETGETRVFGGRPLTFQYQPLDLVRRLSPGLLPREAGPRTLPDLLLFALGIVGLVFLVMYGVALMLGLMLARSITRGVHELSLGTQRLRQGDFDHTIRIRSRDQLGDLAESFNLMSSGIRDLMREQAEKERLEEELRIAREIQMSLLPGGTLSTLPGMRVAALCIPATEVGGDYYDVLPLSDTRMGVLVADVSGKGTSAALYMAELKGLVLSLSRIYDSPARLLVEANRILAESMDSRTFVTMTYAIVDIAERRMRFARAGHNPLIHLEARTGKTRVLTPPGLGLGLDPGDAFERILEEEEVPLDPGDFFLFFTDGLSEAMNEGAELFGEGRLRRILEESEGLTSEQLRARIVEEVERFVGDAAPHDDLTMVVLKVVAEEPAP